MGKKAKGSSKEGASQSEKVSRGEGKPSQKCSVCRYELELLNRLILTCQECKKKVHKGCYMPEERRNVGFTCDMCLKKKKKAHCIICRQFGENEMLKSVEGGFIHVECGLLAPSIQVENYSKLIFSIRKDPVDEGPVLRGTCISCGEKDDHPNAGLSVRCYFCDKFGHFRCWIVELGEDYSYSLMTRFLEMCEKENFLLTHLLSSKKCDSSLKRFFPKPHPPPYNKMVICDDHEQGIQWCPICTETNKGTGQYYQCEECGRFCHESCSGVRPDEKFVCQGCKNRQPFLREYKLFDLLSEMAKIERVNKLSQLQIRILNSFGYKYSAVLQKKITDNKRQIEAYFCHKQISRILEESPQPTAAKKQNLILLATAIMEGDKWEDKAPRMTTKEGMEVFLEDLQKNKKINSHKEQAEKLYEILAADFADSEKFKNFTLEMAKFTEYFQGQASGKSAAQIAKKLKHVSDMFREVFMRDGEKNSKFREAFNSRLGGQFLGTILGKNIPETDLQCIIKSYITIRYFCTQKKTIAESQMRQILASLIDLKQRVEESKQVVQFLEGCRKQIKVKYNGLNRQEIYNAIEKRFQDGFGSLEEIQNYQKNSIALSICTLKGGRAAGHLNICMMEFQVMKKKFMSFCKEGDSAMTEKHFDLIPKLQNFLTTKSKFLCPNEKSALEVYLMKLCFMSNMLKKGEPILAALKKPKQQQNVSQDSISEEVEDLEEMEEQTIFSKLYKVMNHWDERVLPFDFVMTSLVKLATMKVKFEDRLAFDRITQFAKTLIRKVDVFSQSNRIKGTLLRNIEKIIKYFGLEDEYDSYCRDFEEYEGWIKILPSDQLDLAVTLQKPESVQMLLKTLEFKLANVPAIRVDLTPEVKKFSLIRQWCWLSEKMMFSKRKPTINAVQNLKTLFERTMYPNNQVLHRLNVLDNEGKNLNRQIMKYLDKPKVQEFMEIFEQLKMLSRKMTYEEGIKMKKQFEVSNLDITAEVQELQSELKEFQNLPKNLPQLVEKGDLSEMKTARKKILESSFKPTNLHEYDQLLRKIYQVRCLNFEPPITRKQYLQLLSLGGPAAITLADKTPGLLRSYKLIQKAENQLLQNNSRRRNFMNLLPNDDRKIKEIKEDLKMDPTELSNFQKIRINNFKLRENLYRYKTQRAYLEKYTHLEEELSNSLFSNRDLIHEISNMKKEVDEVYRRVEASLGYNSNSIINSDNILRSDRGRIGQKYLKMGIRIPALDTFERDLRIYREIQTNFQVILPNVYRGFSQLCCKLSLNAARTPDLMNMRGKLFFTMFEKMEEAPQIDLLHGLINEGLEMKRLEHPRSHEIFDMVFRVYEKKKEVVSEMANPEQEERRGRSLEDDPSDSDDEDLDDDIDDDEDEEIESSEPYSDDESDEPPAANNNTKGKQIVLDDSD